MIELRKFVFDQETNINVEALEAYLHANMEEMEAQESEIDIDIDSMMVKGKLEKTLPPAPGSIASTASSSNDASAA